MFEKRIRDIEILSRIPKYMFLRRSENDQTYVQEHKSQN